MRLLLVGPNSNPITGQSVAFGYLVSQGYPVIFNSGGNSLLGKLLHFIKYGIFLPLKCVIYRPQAIYLTISRSKVGFFRDLYLFAIARLLKTKVVVHLHGSDFQSFVESSKRLRSIINWGYQAVTKAIVLSEGMRTQFVDFPHIATYVVNNCSSLNEALFSKNHLNGSFKILYLSNLMKTKGVLELVQAVKELNNDGRNIKLHLAGKFLSDNEMDYTELETKLRPYLDSNIEYIGLVTGAQKTEALEWCNCVALPSYYATEAQPLALIEAMAAGRYVITSNAGYIAEFVEHLSNGFVVSEVTVPNIIGALNHVISEPLELERVSRVNADKAKKEFTIERYIAQILKVIRY